MYEKKFRLLQTAAEVDEYITDADLDSTVDWFDNEPSMPTDEFFDRLLGTLTDNEGSFLDLDQLDNEAAKRIMSRARKLRREREL